MNNGTLASYRMATMRTYLEDCGAAGASGPEIRAHLKAAIGLDPLAVSTDVSALRACGEMIERMPFPPSKGRGRNLYFLHVQGARCYCVPPGEPGPHYSRAGILTDGKEWLFNGKKIDRAPLDTPRGGGIISTAT